MDSKYTNKYIKKTILMVKSAMKITQQDNIKEGNWRVGL